MSVPCAAGKDPLAAPVVFFVSTAGLCAELLFGLILSLKAWSHMVYVVISFALLGYGIGSTLYLLLKERLGTCDPRATLAGALILLSEAILVAAALLPGLPIRLTMITEEEETLALATATSSVALPFVAIGFILSLLFSRQPGRSNRLYFWDLMGAGLGAAVILPLLASLEPTHSLFLLSAGSMGLATACLATLPRRRWTALLALAAVAAVAGGLRRPEPDYEIDPTVTSWEWIPGFFRPDQIERRHRSWHLMGRTELHRIVDPAARHWMQTRHVGTFELPLDPPPEFAYFTNGYRAGTPVYRLSNEGLAEHGSEVRPFSQAMEVPYVLVSKPRVLVIGAGGGRDIFMARVHGAAEVVGAEINPATHRQMSRGGAAFDYSGGLYEAPGVRVFNIDGRHLAGTQPDRSFDLVILNGVDTFAALSSGAYAFAENYLYTREAVTDYLRVLRDDGVINFNRWLYPRGRESLKLFAMVFEALRLEGIARPWEHVMVGDHATWGILLVKKSAFTPEEQARVMKYFQEHDTKTVFGPFPWPGDRPDKNFDRFADRSREGREAEFIRDHWADITPATDDRPFFYKFYRFTMIPRPTEEHRAMGGTVFYVQSVIVKQVLLFLAIFILLPLMLFRRRGIALLPRGARLPFVGYFGALGFGFILIEIALMQKFTLLLGSPIHAISVTLAALLGAGGIGSALAERLRGRVGTLSIVVAAIVLLFAASAPALTAAALPAPFGVRAAVCAAALSPIGLCLGMFFPTGLALVGARHEAAVVWAWGINSGFTVLGSTVAIVMAQFLGFNAVLGIAAGVYLLGGLAFGRLRARLEAAGARNPGPAAP